MKQTLNIQKLKNIIGGLLMLEAFFMLIPLAVTIIYKENDWKAFAISTAITAVAGWYLRLNKAVSNHLGKREAFLMTGSVWVFFCIFGMLPFLICENSLDFSSAFFEAMSGFTTTGATTIANVVANMSHGIVIWQSIMQWLGGMGIVVFTLAIIPTLSSSGGVQMFNAEVTGITRNKLLPRIHQTAMFLWGIYFFLTGTLLILLIVGGMDVFNAICHALGTISTGGFSPADISNDYELAITTIFMFLGGMNFVLIGRAVMWQWRPILADTVWKVYFSITILFALLFALANIFGGEIHSWRDYTIIPLYHAVSILTSTGYIHPNFPIHLPFAFILTMLMMFIGGCAGSTSGGVKIDRIICIFKFMSNELHRCLHPNAVMAVRINGDSIKSDLVNKTLAFLGFFVALIVGGGLLLSIFGMPITEALFSALSCVCNTGLGSHFDEVPWISKWILSFLMLAGRLEIYTILILFTRSFWHR